MESSLLKHRPARTDNKAPAPRQAEFAWTQLTPLEVAVAVLDRGGIVIAANAGWHALAAVPLKSQMHWPDSAVGSNYVLGWRSIAGPSFAGSGELLTALALAGDGIVPRCESDITLPAMSGPRQLHVTVSGLAGSDGQIVLTIADVSAARETQTQLRIAASLFESREGKMVTDAQCRILHVNQAFCDITGYSETEVIGQSPSMLSSGRHDAEFYKAMWAALLAEGSWQGEVWNRRKNGDVFPEHLHIASVSDEQGKVSHFVGSISDISLSKAASEEIRNLAYFDPLTRLPNRRLLLERLDQALACCAASDRTGALIVLDLDHFKDLNDTLGHSVGDLLLQQVALRLQGLLRQNELVARLGGDEFVLLVEGLGLQPLEAAASVTALAGQVLAALNEPFALGGHQCRSTPSIGITLFGGAHGRCPDELLQQSDIAMYQAKQAGRNTFRFFDSGMQDAISKRVREEDALRAAIEAEHFILHYQVQVDEQGQARGAEALVRWRGADGIMINPVKFIPLAEETGLILPLGNWVLDQACAQLHAWQALPCLAHMELAINVSARQFHQKGFCELVLAAIARHDIDPRLLKLELTEGILVDNIDETVATLIALRRIGLRFSLDDFGTGYSSLQYLKRLPLDQLKIDQSFVRDLVRDSSDQAIVLTIIAMARSLGMEVIAEGVETWAQRNLLEQLGCKHYQGYLFSRPVDADAFEHLLKAPPAVWSAIASSPTPLSCSCFEEQHHTQ